MDLDNLTIREAREISKLFGTTQTQRLPINVGEKLFVATITAHFTGEVTAVSPDEIGITKAAWIADDGRLSDDMKTGQFNEIEPFPEGDRITLNRATFLYTRRLSTDLPRNQK